MNHKRMLTQLLMWARAPQSALLVSLLLGMILSSLPGVAYAQGEEETEYKISLRSRIFTPQPGIKPLFRDSLTVQLARGEKRHVYLQLKKYLDEKERAKLEEQGVKLLGYIGSYTWYTTVIDRRALEFTVADTVRRIPILGKVRWIGEIRSEDKIEPKIRTEGVGDYNRQPDGRVDVIVVFFPDIPMDTLSIIVRRYGEMVREPGMLNDVDIRLNEAEIERLSSEDAVQWIEEVGPPPEDLNDGSRDCINVDPLQIAPFDLHGNNVEIGQWESGNPDNNHADIAGRITVVEATTVKDHATHVAGILGSDGVLSTTNGGTAAQWRGMADAVTFFSFSSGGDPPEEHQNAIQTNGIDISTNSWGYPYSFGNYRTGSVKFDRVVCGIYGRPIPLVFAAGNDGPGFESIRPDGATAKNTITVGAVNSNDNSIANFSSRGPTDNDLLKPDVVAAGCQVGGDGGITSSIPNLYIDVRSRNCAAGVPGTTPPTPNTDEDDYCFPYDMMCGTSMATPAVSGVVSLMLQQYRQTYFGDDTRDDAPLPSTFKTILCHTAEDLIDNPGGGADLVGPDYVYGYGVVNAVEAVNAVRNMRFREGVILAANDEDSYTFDVATGEDELKVTLSWSDSAGTAGAVDILQNDLDLLIINPDNDEFYPPWELDPTNPATPASRNSYASEALVDDHRDSVNVVEQVAIANPDPGTWTIKVKAADLPFPYQRYSLIAGDLPGHQLEGQVDIVQVLDRSGSMGGYVAFGETARKIEVLRFAADQFIQMMKPDIGNRIGLVQFNQNVVPFDPAHDADLSELTTARVTLLRGTTVPSITHGGATSIGDGLNEALNQFTAITTPNPDQVVLLVTDGKENTMLWIEDVQDNLIANEIAVYPLGLGYGSGINEGKLTNLAQATGGTYRITSDELIFRKFFIEVLAGAVNWTVITDPIGELTRDDIDTIPVTVTADQDGATFTAYWEGINYAIDLELITPSGQVITPSTRNNQIRYGKHPRYAFYQLDFPLGGSLAGEWAGQWKMRLSGTDQIPPGQKVRYSTTAFADGGAKLDIVFDSLFHLTGDSVLIKGKLTKYGEPLTGVKIDVYCNVPIVGAGNVLHNGKVSLDELKKIRIIYGDTINLIDRKLQILAERAGREVLQRGKASFKLYDDGRHGDGKPDDGTYANSFAKTKVPGSYTFRFVASDIPGGSGLKTTREWTKSFYNEVNINPKYSDINIKLLAKTADGNRYSVKIVPKDRFNNYLGPGHPVVVTVSHPGGKRQIQLNDNIDGTYTKEIYITQNELDAGTKWEIEIDGKKFTSPRPVPPLRKWSVSVHGGTAFPTGTFATDFDPGFNVLLDVDYHFSPQFSLVGFFGYNAFESKITGIDATYWINLSANVRYQRLLTIPFSYYIGAGPGIYIPKDGDTEFGVNAGCGFSYEFNPRIAFELGADYHMIFDADIQFVHSHVGVIFRF